MKTSLESSRDASCGAWCPHILRLEKKGKFPKRIKVGERRVGWWLHEVMAWLDHKSS